MVLLGNSGAASQNGRAAGDQTKTRRKQGEKLLTSVSFHIQGICLSILVHNSHDKHSKRKLINQKHNICNIKYINIFVLT